MALKCYVCKDEKEITEFYRNKYNKSGYASCCKACDSIRLKDFRKTYIQPKKDKIYSVWRSILARCNNPNNTSYKNYGGRGITYDKRWDNYSVFLKDMQSSYKEGLCIDRINNNGNYCKENCKWVTRLINNRNKRSNHILTYNGLSKCINEWSELTGIKRTTLGERINTYGWTIERALTTNPLRYA